MVQLIKRLITPRNANKDNARREYILNILLLGAIVLSLVACVDNLFNHLTGNATKVAIPILVVFFFLIFFCFLLFLSRKGRIRFSAIILILLMYLPALYSSYAWGAEVPQGLILYALVIVMTGILINSFASSFITIFTSIYLLVITYLQVNSIYVPMLYWKTKPVVMGDTIVIDVTLLIISTVAWLSNREMEKALKRARSSEEALIRERDSLEIKVQQRTQALQISQMEKLLQLERFSELGRISAGLIHDLASPLNLVSLNLNRMNKLGKKAPHEHFSGSDVLLERAMIGINRLESFVNAARRQVQHQEIKEFFSVRNEISKLVQVLSYPAKENKIVILFSSPGDIRTFGNPIKFNQILTNLIINAIDAYDTLKKKNVKREIVVHLIKRKNIAEIIVQDFGIGISKKNLEYIFQPFFTTKTNDKGTGIGLSICKEMIEKDFKGTISVTSNNREGTKFTMLFPITNKNAK